MPGRVYLRPSLLTHPLSRSYEFQIEFRRLKGIANEDRTY